MLTIIDKIEQNQKIKTILTVPLMLITMIFGTVFLYTFGREVGQIIYETINNIAC